MQNSETAQKRELLTQLKQYRGSIKEIADTCKCSREWVRLVLDGEWEDDNVVLVASRVLVNRKKQAADVKQLLKEAIAMACES